MHMETSVQLPGRREVERVWVPVDEPGDSGLGVGPAEPVDRVTLHIPLADLDFIKRMARYSNALAKVQKIELKTQHSRKSLAEDWLKAKVAEERMKMAKVIAAHGDLPDPKDRKAMEKYAKRVVAAAAKKSV